MSLIIGKHRANDAVVIWGWPISIRGPNARRRTHVRALTHANEALARELDRRWHALLALLGAIEGCALVGCALYERRR